MHMNLDLDLSAAATIINLLGTAVAEAPVIIAFVQNTVVAIESRTMSGADKLTAVLNATEAFSTKLLPGILEFTQEFMTAVAALVEELVAIYHEFGVFIHGVQWSGKNVAGIAGASA